MKPGQFAPIVRLPQYIAHLRTRASDVRRSFKEIAAAGDAATKSRVERDIATFDHLHEQHIEAERKDHRIIAHDRLGQIHNLLANYQAQGMKPGLYTVPDTEPVDVPQSMMVLNNPAGQNPRQAKPAQTLSAPYNVQLSTDTPVTKNSSEVAELAATP